LALKLDVSFILVFDYFYTSKSSMLSGTTDLTPTGRGDTTRLVGDSQGILYNPNTLARTPQFPLTNPSFRTHIRLPVHKMVPFLVFIIVTLAGMVVASVGNDPSRRESRMDGSLEKRDFDCSTSTQRSFAAAA
jgi:hypothetical protein